MQKSKYLFSIFVDFLIMTIIAAAISVSSFAAACFLFPDERKSGEIVLKTELMPKALSYEISEGDAIFDTVTKRKIGTVEDAELFEKDDKIYFVISLKADASPKSDSLRTKSVWFKFSLMENA